MNSGEEAARKLQAAVSAKKCWRCGCLHGTLQAIEKTFATGFPFPSLKKAVEEAQQRLVKIQYDCLGCKVCYPALALNALNQEGHSYQIEQPSCSTEEVKSREGWPPLPGSYWALRYQAPVAVCTLTEDALSKSLAEEADPYLSIVGTLQTENLGIERLIFNVLANPHIRFLVVCGEDSRQAIGHLPGQSLVALTRSGIDEHSHIVGAKGKRPVLRNLSREAIEHFRRTVEVIDLVGQSQQQTISHMIHACAQRSPGPAQPFSTERIVKLLNGYLPQKMISDPAGYFVIYLNRQKQKLVLEHYRNDGVLDTVIEGNIAAELYFPAIDKGLLSRLDHAAYLGRELARAEYALRKEEIYIQDAAPEKQSGCHCESNTIQEDTQKKAQ